MQTSSKDITKISQPIRDSRLLAGQESRTFGSEIKQGHAYFRLEDEEKKFVYQNAVWIEECNSSLSKNENKFIVFIAQFFYCIYERNSDIYLKNVAK